MHENRNSPAEWLRYLLYVAIAPLVVSLISNIPLLSPVAGILSIVISIATIYLLYRLSGTNPRYRMAAILYGIALIAGRIGGGILTLAGSVLSILAEYQEYNGHGELVADKDPKLAGNWSSLFWMQFTVSLGLGLVVSTILVIVALATGEEPTALNTVTTVGIYITSLLLKVLYLVYLHRTVKLLEHEFVM